MPETRLTQNYNMAYLCNDCGNQSSRKFPGGKCPACDSFNIKSTAPVSTRQAIKEKEPKTLLELVLLCLLWGGLAYGAWDRYLRQEPPAAERPAAAVNRAMDARLGGAKPADADF